MPRRSIAFLAFGLLAPGFLLAAATVASAESTAVLTGFLRSEWSVEKTPSGGGRVTGYLYNSNIQDAANVWLRVDQVAADGAVAATYRRRVVGDVLSGDRLSFEVPVPEAAATYRVVVDAVDWVKECR
jgi:hypothetical protein